MSVVTRIVGLFVVFALAACDANNNAGNSIDVATENGQATPSNNVVYFPEGGGIEFAKPFVDESQGPGWKYKEFVVDDDLAGLKSAVIDTMQLQGYVRHESIELQGFEQGLSFSKAGSLNKVSYRMKKIKSAVGERVLLRLSWSI